MSTAHDFSLDKLDGGPLPLAQFAGRPLVIVNTASQCGFTPQYAQLQNLWQKEKDSGLVVVGVPCNDFAGQEPGDAATIGSFCERRYGVSFPLAAKVHVRGGAAHPLFQWLAREGGFLSRPRWNFYKYLIGRDGRLKAWFGSVTPPASRRFGRAVEKLLQS
jgi:glutathione peroxidase